MVMDRVEVITSVERRRRWSATEKARLVAAMNEPGPMVTEIARREGVDASLIAGGASLRRSKRGAGVCAVKVAVRRERDGVHDRAAGCAPANVGAVVFHHDRFRRAGSHDDRGRPELSDWAKVIGALTARDRWR